MLFKIENPLHMQLVISLSFVKLLWPFVRYISYSHDQDHVHSTYILPTSTLEVAQEHFTHPSIFTPVNKTPFYSWLLSPSYHLKKKDMGYAKRNKCHAQESMMKKKVLDTWRSKVYIKKEKESWTHEGPSIQKKEREIKIAHVQRKKNKRDRWFMKGVHTPSTQIFTHMHILIKVYDLFLLWIRSLT